MPKAKLKKSKKPRERMYRVTVELVEYQQHVIMATSASHAEDKAERLFCSESNEGHCSRVEQKDKGQWVECEELFSDYYDVN